MHCSNIDNSQDMQANKKSINRKMDKEEVAYIPNEIVASRKK